MSYCKELSFLVLFLVFVGCTTEARTWQESGSISFVTSNESVIDERDFAGHEEVEFCVKSESPLAIGFKANLSAAGRKRLQAKASESGNFDDNFAGRVDQVPKGNGIGAKDGGVIEMKPVNGEIRFKFKNLMSEKHRFTVYQKEVSQ